MDKMLILLKQLHLQDEVSALKHAYIERVVVHKDNSYTFYIGCAHIVPLNEIRLLFSAKNEFPYLNNEEINEKITKMQSDFLDIYNYKKDGDDNGNNENMGN